MTKTAEDVRQSFGYVTKPELDALRDLVLELPPNPVIINIGAGAGTSGLLFAETREDTLVHTFDITNESSPFGCLAGERLVFEQANLGHLKEVRWFQYHGDSKNFGEVFAEQGRGMWVDLLFVDGDHSYDGCMGDMEIWGEMVKPGGVMAVHDYKKFEMWERAHPDYRKTMDDEDVQWVITQSIKPYPGVDKSVDDFMKNNAQWEWVAVVDSLAIMSKV